MSNSEDPPPHESWRVDETEEAIYNFSDEKGVWQPKAEVILSMFKKLAEGGPLPLNWTCPGRRPPEREMIDKENGDEKMEIDEAGSKDEESIAPEPSAFDFDEPTSDVITKITPRRTPGGSSRTPRTEKRVAKMDNIMDSLRKQQQQRTAEREARKAKGLSVGTPAGRSRLLNFGSPKLKTPTSSRTASSPNSVTKVNSPSSGSKGSPYSAIKGSGVGHEDKPNPSTSDSAAYLLSVPNSTVCGDDSRGQAVSQGVITTAVSETGMQSVSATDMPRTSITVSSNVVTSAGQGHMSNTVSSAALAQISNAAAATDQTQLCTFSSAGFTSVSVPHDTTVSASSESSCVSLPATATTHSSDGLKGAGVPTPSTSASVSYLPESSMENLSIQAETSTKSTLPSTSTAQITSSIQNTDIPCTLVTTLTHSVADLTSTKIVSSTYNSPDAMSTISKLEKNEIPSTTAAATSEADSVVPSSLQNLPSIAVNPAVMPSTTTAVNLASMLSTAAAVNPAPIPSTATAVNPALMPSTATAVNPALMPSTATAVKPASAPSTSTVVNPALKPSADTVVNPALKPSADTVVNPALIISTSTEVNPAVITSSSNDSALSNPSQLPSTTTFITTQSEQLELASTEVSSSPSAVKPVSSGVVSHPLTSEAPPTLSETSTVEESKETA